MYPDSWSFFTENVTEALERPNLEIGLLGTVLYHSFNGFRILLFDLGVAVKAQRKVFWAAFVLTLAVLAYGGEKMLSHLMH